MPLKLSPKQKDYWVNACRRWNVKSGATRSGKTYLDYYIIPRRIRAVAGRDGLVVILGNTRGTLQRNIIEPLQRIWTPTLVSNITSDNTAMLFGEKCYCLGADKINQVDRIRGSSIKYCYGDEVVTWHEDVFGMLKSRLDKDYSCFDGTCNPDNPNHWFKAFLDGDADIYHQHYTIDDNPFLTPQFVDNLKREYAGTVYYDRFILGKWALAEGLVYSVFDEGKNTYSTPPWNDECGEYYISVDYGTMNPTSMGLWRIHDGKAYRIKEYYYSGRNSRKQLTDEEYYAALERLAEDRVIQSVIVDPSAASFIAAIRRHGKYTVRAANNAVLDGIRHTAACINQDKLLIHRSCENTLNELKAYRWDESAGEDKVIKENDHAMDDMRYFVMTVLRRIL